ncbi:MAG: GWxTD domain-containing protein [bacterium]|nr:GWxTD domain-containing protein [bacterium]
MLFSGSFPHRCSLLAALSAALLAAALPATAALVRPLDGDGGFAVVLDYANLPAADGAADVLLLFSVANDGLRFREHAGGGLGGSLAVEATLVADDGREYVRRETIALAARTRGEAASPTSYQVFTLRLPGVRASHGALRCRLEDRGESGAPDVRDVPAASVRGEWYLETAPADLRGLWLHAPLFLSGAPQPGAGAVGGPRLSGDRLAMFLHPNRRYGLEQERLQVAFDAEAVGLGAGDRGRLPRTLLMQVLARDLDYVVRDTLALGLDAETFAAGGLASVTWSYDVNRLPPGSYQLSCAPLDGWGNAWVVEFDVIWQLQAMTRPAGDTETMGRLVLLGDRREAFLQSGRSGREAILAEFWDELDPDPATAGNEALEEYRQRASYVNRFLGGMGRTGPVDDRGLVYLLLGPPDEIEKQDVPANALDFEDALSRVHDSFLPANEGLVLRDQYTDTEQSTLAVRERLDRATSQEKYKAFELWKYRARGRPLFPNQYSSMPLGLNFLFLARLGGGFYTLESTNAHTQGGPSR